MFSSFSFKNVKIYLKQDDEQESTRDERKEEEVSVKGMWRTD